MQSYLAGVTADIMHSDWPDWQTRSLYGIKFSVGTKPPNIPGAEDVFTGASGLKVWRNPNAFPRAWAVHRVLKLTDPGGRKLVHDRLPDLHDAAFLTDTPPGVDACAGDNVTLMHYSGSQVSIRADMKCRGMVVLSDTYFPGWNATVDGRPEAIHKVDFCLRGVVVPAGVHELRFRYQPPSVIAGGILTAAGILLALGIAWAGTSRKYRLT
jgi:hypothetical protein